MGKSFGCVGIDIERKNISISGGGGDDIVYQTPRIGETKILVYPEPLTGNKIYQTNTLQFPLKNALKTSKM